MSDLTTLARPYAKAIFKQAYESAELDVWSDFLQNLSKLMRVDGFLNALKHPKLNKNQRLELVHEVFDAPLNEYQQRFLMLLAENQRFESLPFIADVYEELKHQAENILVVHVESAMELTDQQNAALTNALSKRFQRNIQLETHVDNQLIGGAVVRAGDLMIDGSIRGRLEKMKAVLDR